MAYKQNLLFHVKKVNELLPRFDAESSLNLKNLVLEVRGRNRHFQLLQLSGSGSVDAASLIDTA